MGNKRKWIFSGLFLIILIMLEVILQGCQFKIVTEEKKEEIPFVIVSEECIPKELSALIEQRKEEEIKLTYADQGQRYIVIGYGKQDTGGYSIYIKDMYTTSNAVYVDSCLLGPSKENSLQRVPSYPVIVLQISEMGLPVVFK